jgi:hypothetical protein
VEVKHSSTHPISEGEWTASSLSHFTPGRTVSSAHQIEDARAQRGEQFPPPQKILNLPYKAQVNFPVLGLFKTLLEMHTADSHDSLKLYTVIL